MRATFFSLFMKFGGPPKGGGGGVLTPPLDPPLLSACALDCIDLVLFIYQLVQVPIEMHYITLS